MNSALPSPPLNVRVDLPTDPSAAIDLASLPARPGVYALEDDSGNTITLASTANLRRAIAAKLTPESHEEKSRRRIDLRCVTRTIVAAQVGSAFEADWAYLQLARQRLPQSYRGVLDRWQAWFIQCHRSAEFPQWTKTAHPTNQAGDFDHIGPFRDKHAAGQYIEMLQDAFDLCRYHHILVQAPNATACVYKEMGRCAAPCDGSASMDEYRAQFAKSIEFAAAPIGKCQDQMHARMRQASDQLDFETAQRCRMLLDRTALAEKPEFTLVDRLERFTFAAIMPGEKKNWSRIFLIRGGWIAPLFDVPAQIDASAADAVLNSIRAAATPSNDDFSPVAVENIGLVCWHLFRPRTSRLAGSFLRLDDALDAHQLIKSLRRLEKNKPSTVDEPPVPEQEMESFHAG